MKKIYSIAVILFLVLLSVNFVSANSYSGSDGRYKGNMGLTKGWNLVPTIGFDLRGEQHIKRLGIVAIYQFDNEKKYYIPYYPEYDFSKHLIFSLRYDKVLQSFASRYNDPKNVFTSGLQDRDLGRIGAIFDSAMWVYSDKDQAVDIDPHSDSIFIPYNSVRLTNGWNFLTITPDMVEKNEGKTVIDLKGSCNIEKAYVYAGDKHGKWKDASSLELESRLVWFGIVIKVSDDECYLGEGYLGLPPSLPGIETPTTGPASLEDVEVKEDVKCYDTDPGQDIFVIGKAIEGEGFSLIGYQDMCVYETDGSEGYYAQIAGKSYSVKYACNNETDGTCLLIQTYCDGENHDFKVFSCPGSCRGGACIR